MNPTAPHLTHTVVYWHAGFAVQDALALFNKYDKNKNGSLDIEEFARGFLGKDEYDGVTNMRSKAPSVYPKNLHNHLNGPESHNLSTLDRIMAVKEVARDQNIQRGSLMCADAEQRLREKVLQRIGNLHNNQTGQLGLQRAFLMFDPEDKGTISPDNFVRILENFGFAKKDAAIIFRKYDINGNGEIDVREFQSLLMKPKPQGFSTLAMAESKMKAKRDHVAAAAAASKVVAMPVETVEERLKVKIEQRVGNLWNKCIGQLGERRAFSLFNPDERGIIHPGEFCRVMDGFGFSQHDAMALFKKHDANRSGTIDREEFKHMVFDNRARPKSVSHIMGKIEKPSGRSKPGTSEKLRAWGPSELESLGIARPSSQASSRRPQMTRPVTHHAGSRPDSRAWRASSRAGSNRVDVQGLKQSLLEDFE